MPADSVAIRSPSDARRAWCAALLWAAPWPWVSGLLARDTPAAGTLFLAWSIGTTWLAWRVWRAADGRFALALALSALAPGVVLLFRLRQFELGDYPSAVAPSLFAWFGLACLAVLRALAVPAVPSLAAAAASSLLAGAAWWLLGGIAWFLPTLPTSHFEVGGFVTSPTRGYLVLPHSRLRTYYPDNSRGYFQVDRRAPHDPWRPWTLEYRADYPGKVALDRPASAPLRVRLSLDQPASDPLAVAWRLKRLGPGRPGPAWVRLRARASQVRSARLHVQSGSGDQPRLLHQADFELQPHWTDFQVHLELGPADATIELALGLAASTAAVELERLELGQGDRALLAPPGVTPYFVEALFNSLGFRDRELAVPRPAEVIRVVVLGDSVIYGQGVHAEDLLTRRLERHLNDAPTGRLVEVANCGLPGYSPMEEVAGFGEAASAYQPQLVLLSLYENDDETHLPPPASAASPGTRQAPGQFGGLYADPEFRRTTAALVELAGWCQEHGAQLAAFYFRYGPRTKAWQRLQQATRPVLDAEAIPWIDLGETIYDPAPEAALTVDRLDGHPNEIAHALAAAALAEFLEQEGLLPTAALGEGSTAADQP